MSAGPVIELRCGLPGWHRHVLYGVLLAVIFGLVLTPVKWPCTLVILLFAAAVSWKAASAGQGANASARLLVHSDLAMTLMGPGGKEIPVELAGSPWMSPVLIVIPLREKRDGIERIVVSRALNDPDAFRRFAVLCRFGFADDAAGRQNSLDSRYSSKITGG